MAQRTATLMFSFEYETKGSARFFETDKDGNRLNYKDATIPTLYLRKDKLGGKIPKTVHIDINVDV